MTIKVVLISDTHNFHDQVVVPDGDILIHAGDATGRGSAKELAAFGAWIRSLPHKHKLVCPGNHDFGYEENMRISKLLVEGGGVIVLHNESVTFNIDGRDITVYMSGSTPFFHNWAFNLYPKELEAEWAKITPCDILVTHGPAYGIMDLCPNGDRPGCKHLLKRIKELKPKLFVHGHIHGGYGTHTEDGTLFVNASTCTEQYIPTNPPIVIEI